MARLLQKRVGCALGTDRARGPVAAEERDVVAERQQFFFDRADQGLVIAARNTAAPDRAPEQHVAHDGEPLRGVEEGTLPGECPGQCSTSKARSSTLIWSPS